MKIPHTYPTVVGINSTTGITSIPKIIAAFRSKPSALHNIVASLVAMPLLPYDASDNGVMVVQIIGNVTTVVNGTFLDIDNSNLQINRTATSYTDGKVAVTVQMLIGTDNKGQASVITTSIPEDLGLTMNEEQQFVIVAACSSGVTSSLLWSVNWTESDDMYTLDRIILTNVWQSVTNEGIVQFKGNGVYALGFEQPTSTTGIAFKTDDILEVNDSTLWAKSDTSMNSSVIVNKPQAL